MDDFRESVGTKVSEISIVPIRNRNGLVAFASCVIDDKIHVGGIGIYTRMDGAGYRLTYPNKKLNKSSIKLCYPINRTVGEAILRAITEEYERLLGKDL